MSAGNENLFVFRGWSKDSRQSPAAKFIEEYTLNFLDSRKFDDAEEWLAHDSRFVKADGTSYTGFDTAWGAVLEQYGPLRAHQHLPIYATVSETANGWSMFGQADCYFDLPGTPAADESRVKDPSGREWDVYFPGAYTFEYVKDASARHHGIRMKEIHFFTDTLPAAMKLVKRGVMQLE